MSKDYEVVYSGKTDHSGEVRARIQEAEARTMTNLLASSCFTARSVVDAVMARDWSLLEPQAGAKLHG